MAADNFFIPNAEEFFASILSIISQCTACLDVRDGDQAELLSRRLEQYEETLRVVYQRITELIRPKTNLGETGKPILS